MSAVHIQRGFGGLIYLGLACILGLYFTFAAVQGDYGMFARVAINAEAEACGSSGTSSSGQAVGGPGQRCRT
jgi:hypothetical protein